MTFLYRYSFALCDLANNHIIYVYHYFLFLSKYICSLEFSPFHVSPLKNVLFLLLFSPESSEPGINTRHWGFPTWYSFLAESTEAMRIKCLAQGRNNLSPLKIETTLPYH